ncbi:MAG: aminotransferase class IV [Alphaproteobacteria bacterium]|nr:aminotransferase class IV [Alphaproteobacteria bacterium]
MTIYSFINNTFEPIETSFIHINNRGLLLADGIFETLRVYNQKPFLLVNHLERLEKSAKILSIPFPKINFDTTINKLIDLNNFKDAIIRITLTRGASQRGLSIQQCQEPVLIITCHPYQEIKMASYKCTISSIKRNPTSPIANMKTLSYMDNVIALIQAQEKGFDDALFLNIYDQPVCSTKGNIFIVHNHSIYTPSSSDGILNGITRNTIIELIQDQKWPLYEQSLSYQQLIEADEIFMTNSVIEIQPITQLDTKLLNNNFYSQKLKTLYKNYIENNL